MNAVLMRLSLGLVVALVLTIIPLPSVFSMVRPAWVLLIILYTQCFFERYFKIFITFLIGLYVDVLTGAMMGQHVFALLVTTWFVSSRIQRFRYYSMAHQLCLIAVFSLIYQLNMYLVDALLGHAVFIWQILVVPFTTVLFWPWLCVLIPAGRGHGESSQWSYYDL